MESNIGKAPLIAIVAICILGFLSSTVGDSYGGSAKPIRIGWAGPTTGPASSTGLVGLNGAKLAAKQINDSGGINGRKIDLIVADDRNQPEQSRSLAEKFYARDKVHAMISSLMSGPALTALEVARKYNGILVAPISQSSKLTGSDYPNVFAMNCSTMDFANVLGKFVTYELHLKTISMLNEKGEVGMWWKDGMEKVWKEIGGPEIISADYVGQAQHEYRTELTRIKGLAPDGLWITSPSASQQNVIWRQVNEVGIKAKLLAGPGYLVLPELNLKYFEGTYCDDIYIYAQKNPENISFVKAYENEYAKKPDKASVTNYEAVYLLAMAIDKAHSDKPADISAQLHQGIDWVGPMGKKLVFGKDGRVQYNPFIYQIKDGIPQKLE